jgi:hypothetical protein
MHSHEIEEPLMHASSSDELAEMNQDDDNEDIRDALFYENHVMLMGNNASESSSDDEGDYNHQDTGSGDQNSNDYF